MVLQLDDFKEEKVSLSDFGPPETTGVPVSDRNASMIAAVDSALTGPTLEQYRETKQNLLDPETRERFLLRQQMIRDALTADAYKAAPNVIADESVDDSIRQHALMGVATDASVPPIETTPLDLLAEEAAVADSDVNETEQAAKSRISGMDLIEEVNRQKIETQKAINGIRQTMDTSVASTVVDMAELMVPMAEWLHYGKLLKDVQEGQSEWKLLGGQKQKLFDHIKSLPIEQRAEFTQRLIDLVEQHENVVLWDGNTIATLDTLNNALLNDEYSNFERWFDNATSVLDVLGIGATVRAFGKAGKIGGLLGTAEEIGIAERAVYAGYEEVDAILPEVRIQATHTDVPTTAPSQVVKDVNPEEARKIHKAAINDDTGEYAEALYGTSREEAAAKDLLPEPEVRAGEMPNKVSMDGPSTEEPAHLKAARNKDGNTYLSEVELERVQENLIDGLSNIEGMKAHRESMVIRTNKDSTFSVNVRYSPRDSGFETPKEALDNALHAFRNYRFQENDFTLLGRMGDKWIEITPEDARAFEKLQTVAAEKGVTIKPKITDYAVELKADYRFRPEDLNEWEILTTKRNWLDRIPAHRFSLANMGQGSLTQNLLDASSVLHPQIVEPTAVAADRQFFLKKLYIETFEGFSQQYAKMPKERRAAMTDYINEANFEGLPFDIVDLANRGFSQKEIGVLKEWRRANDAMWYATNEDMANTLRSRGFKIFTHSDSQTKLVGRPVQKHTVSSSDLAYDPKTGQVASIEDIDSLYETGGTVFKVSDPIKVDNEWTDLVISRNTPSAGYVKEIGEGERVLAYRDGYYPVMYDAKWFITMKVKGRNGKVMTKVVASAKNTGDRNRALEQLRKAHPDAAFDARPDKRRADQVAHTFDPDAWQLSSSSGMSAQKFRGERLKDAGVDLHKAGYSNLKDPLEAVAAQVNQMSQKVAMRPVLDSMRARWMDNYGKYLDLPIDKNTGQLTFPKNIADIKGKAETPSKMVADARTMFNYIYSMENGYINGIDEGYKSVLHATSDLLGEAGLFKAEEWTEEFSKYSPSGASKSVAFKLLLAANPARQLIIQSAQNLQLAPINPQYFAKGLVSDIVAIDKARLGLTKDKRALELWKAVQESGIIEAVDAHNFIREDLLRLADLTAAQKAKTVTGAPLNFTQKLGFDVAEQHVLMAAWLTFRDKAIKAGKDVTSQRVKDEILGQARTYTFNMNRSGEMPYSKNTLALASQFFSVQHKALLQGVTNRNLSRTERAKLLAYTTALFGVDATVIGVGVDAAFGDGEPSPAKDAIKNGLLDYTLNTALTVASGEEQQIDWGDLAPAEAYGVGNAIVALLNTGFVDGLVANSPSGSLLFGSNPRVTQAFKTAMRYFNVYEDYDDPELSTKYSDVVLASANMFSGYSNAFKSNYAFYTGKKMSSVGNVTDEDVTKVESALAFFGFQTKTESGYRKLRELKYGDAEFTQDDVNEWYSDLKRHLARRGKTTREGDVARRVLSEAWAVFSSDRPKAVSAIVNNIQRDATNGDYKVITGLIKDMGMMAPDDVWAMINEMPAGEPRDRLTEMMKTLEENSQDGR